MSIMSLYYLRLSRMPREDFPERVVRVAVRLSMKLVIV